MDGIPGIIREGIGNGIKGGVFGWIPKGIPPIITPVGITVRILEMALILEEKPTELFLKQLREKSMKQTREESLQKILKEYLTESSRKPWTQPEFPKGILMWISEIESGEIFERIVEESLIESSLEKPKQEI